MHTPFYPCKNITDRKVIVWDLSEIQKEESVEDGEYSKGAKFVHCGHTMGVNDISFNLNDKGVMCSVGQDNVLQVWKEKSEFYVDEGEQEELKLPQKPNSAVKEVDEGAQKAATANDEPTMMDIDDNSSTMMLEEDEVDADATKA